METQRLRNLTTGRLHTEMDCIYQDLEYITGMDGLMTHMLPNVMRAVEPWLREKVAEPEYWDGEYCPSKAGSYPIEPMSEVEQKAMLTRYSTFSHPFANKPVITVTS
ncbi:MAG: hypothetical protein ABUJ92_00170 [Desulfobacterales bacterium]